MNCPVCRTAHQPGDRYCRACGAPLVDESSLAAQSGEELRRSQAVYLAAISRALGNLTAAQNATASQLDDLRRELRRAGSEERTLARIALPFEDVFSLTVKFWFSACLLNLIVFFLAVLLLGFAGVSLFDLLLDLFAP